MNKEKIATVIIAALAAAAMAVACARPAEPKKPAAEAGPKHEYKDLKPDVYDIPDGVKAALPGLQNDKIYIYREIAPTLNLVAYAPNYSLADAPKMAAKAFEALAPVPDFRKGIDFWIIQIQPAAGEKDVPQKPEEAGSAPKNSQVFVWGVKPSEVDEYLKSHDLLSFIANSEYLLVNDQIMPKGEERAKLFPSLKPAPAPAPLPGSTAAQPAPAPQGGATVNK